MEQHFLFEKIVKRKKKFSRLRSILSGRKIKLKFRLAGTDFRNRLLTYFALFFAEDTSILSLKKQF